MRDEGRPLGSGVQMRLSNHLELLPLRGVVVSVKEKAVVKTRQVCTANRQVSMMKMSESELPTKCQKQPDDVETVQTNLVQDKSSECLVTGWAASGMRHA